MAHLDTEAGDFGGDDLNSAAALIGDLNLGDDTPGDDEGDEGEGGNSDDGGEGDDTDHDGDEDQDDEGDEQADEPAIDAPVSLTAEEKAKFAALPKEAQQYVADLEARRATQVQTATTKAAEAQRTAEARAAQADAQAQARYAQQLKAIGERLAPERPDPALAQHNPAAWIAQNAQYEAAKAQHDEFMQQAESLGEAADNALSDAEMAQRGRDLMAIPEFQNEETRTAFLTRAENAAKALGLDVEHVARNATASEIKALSEIHTWREKAEKYDAATARQMQRVREGRKAKTVRPNAAQPSSAEGRGVRESRERLRQTGHIDDATRALIAAGFK